MREIEQSLYDGLCDRADKKIQEIISNLPSELKEKAEQIECFLSQYSPDGYEVYGRCMGFNPGHIETSPIVLYVAEINDWCNRDKVKYEDRISDVYLHELGHCLGLDEEDLHKRGL